MAELGGVTARKAKDGVALRFPRPVIVTVAIALAVAWTALASVPALADQTRQQQWWLGDLHITQAQRISNGSGVTVALLDTGVDSTQPDIAGSVITGPDFTKSGEKPGGPDYGIHGTAMASLIVGHGHGPGGAEGILGVAPGARLLSVRVTLDATDPLATDSAITSGLPAAIAAGIMYAVRNGAQVIDLPLDPGQSLSALVASTALAPAPGTPLTPAEFAEQAAAGGSAAEQAAVRFALSKGVVLVAPAGDNGTGTDAANFPASYPGVISVGAFDSTIVKAPFTSHQSYVTLTAAGSGMTAAIPPSGYTTVSSTAAASAIVTGIAALIKSVYPELTPAQVTQALITSTVFRPAGGMQDGSGHGTVDAARALAAAAVIAKPGPPRAGNGAVSRQLPAAPPVPFVDRGLGPKLERYGLISGALLVVLLLPIIAYALMRRRRARSRAAARGERDPAGRPVHAPAVEDRVDRMLEHFAAPAQPAGSRGTRAMAGSGPGSRPTASQGGAFGSFGDSAGLADDPLARRLGGPPGRLPLTPMTRTTAARPPKVSGTPPWGPAPKPDTDLPWAAGPPSALIRRGPIAPFGPIAAPFPPADTQPHAAFPSPATPAPQADPVSPADPSAPADPSSSAGPAAPADPSAPAVSAAPLKLPPPLAESIWDTAGPGRGLDPAEAGPSEDDPEAEAGPIFVWNPSANTDAFPKVPPKGD